jgi:hypothetical protein
VPQVLGQHPSQVVLIDDQHPVCTVIQGEDGGVIAGEDVRA